jgi:hypothetical protein
MWPGSERHDRRHGGRAVDRTREPGPRAPGPGAGAGHGTREPGAGTGAREPGAAGDVAAYRGRLTSLFVHLVHGPYDRKLLERHLAARMSLRRRASALLALRLGRRLPDAVAKGVRVGGLRCASLSVPAPSLLAVLVPWPKRDVSALIEIGGSWMVSGQRVLPLDHHVDAFLESFRWDAR